MSYPFWVSKTSLDLPWCRPHHWGTKTRSPLGPLLVTQGVTLESRAQPLNALRRGIASCGDQDGRVTQREATVLGEPPHSAPARAPGSGQRRTEAPCFVS